MSALEVVYDNALYTLTFA